MMYHMRHQMPCVGQCQPAGYSRAHVSSSSSSSSLTTSRRGRRYRGLQCHASVVWRQLDRTKTWLTHPRSARTKGVVHFLGGAFAGAAPQLLYNSFIELLADAGYTVVSTPYKVTFQHDVCARQVRQAFQDSLAELRATGRSYLAPPNTPQFGVGHSNGALLHLLINSYEPGATDANVIISYNNLQVSDAIPIPGFLDSLQPTVQAARAAGASSGSSSSSGSMSSMEEGGSGSSSSSSDSSSGSSSGAEQRLLAAAAATLPLAEQQQLLLAGAAPALEQLSSVVNEVGDGLTDFTPSPQESRAIIRAGYACPATLLVQFENDNFDETPEMQQLLSERGQSSSSIGGGDAAAAAAAAVDGGSMRSVPQSGYTSAWNSIDEDVSMDNLLQQLQELQSSLQQQEEQRQQLQAAGGAGGAGGGSGVPELQQRVLPGSHITPCGAELQSGVDVGAFDVLLNSSRSAPGSQADLQVLSQTVLAFLDGRRPQATQRRAGMKQQQQQAPLVGKVAAAASAATTAAAAADTPSAAVPAAPTAAATTGPSL